MSIMNIISVFESQNPDPKIELDYINNFTLLVAVMLSAQSTDVGVNKATKDLFSKYSTPNDFIALGEVGLMKYIKTIGLYKNKAKYIIAMTRDLILRFNGIVPDNMQDLVSLMGVGRKTASVVLAVAFNKPYIAVDTHVGRVSRRLGLSQNINPDKVQQDLMSIVPQEYMSRMNHWMVLHGRYVCKALRPACDTCSIKAMCKYFAEEVCK